MNAKVADTWLETFLDTGEQISNEMVDCFLKIAILSHALEKIENCPTMKGIVVFMVCLDR